MFLVIVIKVLLRHSNKNLYQYVKEIKGNLQILPNLLNTTIFFVLKLLKLNLINFNLILFIFITLVYAKINFVFNLKFLFA